MSWVLATVTFATGGDGANGEPPQIRFEDRRVLLSTQRLQVALLWLE